MKHVIYHWVEIRKLKVPDEAPTDDICSLQEWIEVQRAKHGKTQKDFLVSTDTRDCEIVDVIPLYKKEGEQ